MLDIKAFVDVENATQSRRIYWDREIYELEMERIFARNWLFLTHESLIPDYGDFVVTKMGEDEVVVWRQKDGGIRTFLNQCTHRGAKLCMAEAGNARAFSCGYHGWAFSSDGNLASVPLEQQSYGPGFDRCKRNLREVPRVESYRGFIFACMDPAVPGLQDFLGDAAWYMDLWADVPGGVELVGPPARSIIRANWKTPAENFIGDTYHVGWTHQSALTAAAGQSIPQEAFAAPGGGFQATTRYGHGLGIGTSMFGAMLHVESCPEFGELLGRRQAEVEAKLGPKGQGLITGAWDATIFPNCSYLWGTNVFKVWHPLGPDKVEIMTWAIVGKEMSDDLKHRMAAASHRVFGTAGILEADDLDSFEYANIPNSGYVTRQGRLDLTMGKGMEREDSVYPGVVGDYVNELAQRGYYRFYADCMDTGDWPELEARTENWKADLLGK